MNYQKELDKLISRHEEKNEKPKLFIHSCCAPCSSYVLEYLSKHFLITIFYYNPNIYPEDEYERRRREQVTLIQMMNLSSPVQFMEGNYQPKSFFDMAKGLEAEQEGGERCFLCYEMRLREAARLAGEYQFDYFTTTLSISPYKNAAKLNEIGNRLAEEFGIVFLPSDFKKNNGYQRSIQLSREYELYRQDYCGCIYSKLEREQQKERL